MLLVKDQPRIYFDNPVALSFIAGSSHWTSLTVLGLIKPGVLFLPASGLSFVGFNICHALSHRAVVAIVLFIIMKVFNPEGILLPLISLLYIEVVKFDIRLNAFVFKVFIVLLGSVTGIGHQDFRCISKCFYKGVNMSR